MHLPLFNIWSQAELIWPEQLINQKKHKTGYTSVKFTDINLTFGVIIAESNIKHILWALIDVQNICFNLDLKLLMSTKSVC